MRHLALTLAFTCLPGTLAAQAACDRMEALTERMNQWGGTEVVQDIRSIYTINGLSFGGEQTARKCRDTVRMLQELRYQLEIPRLMAAAIERGARARHLTV